MMDRLETTKINKFIKDNSTFSLLAIFEFVYGERTKIQVGLSEKIIQYLIKNNYQRFYIEENNKTTTYFTEVFINENKKK